MHGFIWDNDGIALEEWKNGYTYEGEYMSNRAITYTTKYMLKVHKEDKLYVPKIMCSAGIGNKWIKGVDAKRAKYVPHGTLEEYRGVDGIKRGMPIYYKNLIYTEEEREKLWIEKLNKGERWIGGSCIRRKNYNSDEDFEKACIKTLEERRREARRRGNEKVKEFDKERYRKQLFGLRKKENTIETKKKLTEEEVWRLLDADIERNIAERKLKKQTAAT